MATDNNTGGMQKALDDYNKYNRHNNYRKELSYDGIFRDNS